MTNQEHVNEYRKRIFFRALRITESFSSAHQIITGDYVNKAGMTISEVISELHKYYGFTVDEIIGMSEMKRFAK